MVMMMIFTVVATIIIIYKNILPKEGCSFIRGLWVFFLSRDLERYNKRGL